MIRKTLTILAHVLAWLVVVYIFNQVFRVELRTFHIINGKRTEAVEVQSFAAFAWLVIGFKALYFYSGALPVINRLLRKHRWWAYTGCMTLLAVIMFPIERIIFTFLSDKPLLTSFLWLDILLYVVSFGISTAWFLVLDHERAEKLSRLIAEEQLRTELNFLKAQINPHFFLNTLNNLYSMAQARDIDELEDGILQLSEMMRYILYECQADTVPLEQEIKYIKSYIGLTLMRYRQDGHINVNVVIDDFPSNFMIAPVILIPFVENAFKHGISLIHQSVIDIHIALKNNQLFLTIKNSNHNKEYHNFNHKGIGIINVKRRLEMLYPYHHQLEIQDTKDFYTVQLQLS